MSQLLLMPDPKPLVERLGSDFFRSAPQCPGVYLMRDAADAIVYVGKAKNLRKRLASYRVANPERLRPRQLRLLRSVSRIELVECADEASALAKEAALLRSVRPRFNRAGTWPGPSRFIGCRLEPDGLALSMADAGTPGWTFHGPFGAGAFHVRAALLRLLWCALHHDAGLFGLPQGWFNNVVPPVARIPQREVARSLFEMAEESLLSFFGGEPDTLVNWIQERTALQRHPLEAAVQEADLETAIKFAQTCRQRQ